MDTETKRETARETKRETAREEAARLLDEWRMTFFGWLTPIENSRLGEIVENIREREA